MCEPPTRPADASSPDADWAGPDASTPPEWLVRFLALLMLLLIRHMPAYRQRRAARLPEWWVDRPDLPAGSTQALAASLRGAFGTAIARMCWLEGIGPAHHDWAYVSRIIVTFGGSLRGLDGTRHPRPWWERPEIVPGMSNPGAATQPTAASLLAQRLAAAVLPTGPVPDRTAGPARNPDTRNRHATPPFPWWRVFARAAADPPIRAGTASPIRAGTDPPSGLGSACDGPFYYA